MFKLIFPSLKRLIRSRIWIIDGTEPESGEPLRVIYLGKEVHKNYMTDLIFCGNCKERYVEKKALWPLIHLIINLPRCSLMIIEGDYLDFRSEPEKGEFFIPLWLQSDVDIPLVARNKSAKEDLRRIKKNQLGYAVTKEPDQFHDFFHNMFLPYIKGRHQDRTISIGYDFMMQRAKDGTCELLLINKDNEPVAGLLIVFEENLPRLWSVGIKDGDIAHLKTGVVAATFYFASLYLKGRGYEKIRTGSSRAFLKDGVLQYKKKWGVRVFPHETEGFFLKSRALSRGLKEFFTRHPFVFVDKGKLCGAVFIEDDTGYSGEIYEKFHKDYYMDGLDDLIVFQWGEKKNRVLDSYKSKRTQGQEIMDEHEKNLEKACSVFVKDILHLEKGEKFLIYVDQGSDIGTAKAIQDFARKNSVQTSLLELNSGVGSEEKLSMLLRRIEDGNFDAMCELSAQFFFMTAAWQKAMELGCRIYSLGAVDADSFIRCVGQTDHRLMYRFGTALANTLRKARSIQILSEQGTRIEFKMNPSGLLDRALSKVRPTRGASQRSWIGSPSGMLKQGGSSTYMAGQVAFHGIPDTIEGTAVIDGYLWPPEEINPIDEPIILKIKKGSVVEIGGSPAKSEILRKWLDGKDKTVKHFCVGFNPGAELSGKIMEAERVFGAISVGFGKHPFHTDGIFKNSSLLMNGRTIVKRGEFVHKDLSALGKNLIKMRSEGIC